MINANMIAPHCLIERHGSASRFQDVFVDPRKWFRRHGELFRLFNGRRAAGAGEPCDSGDRPALDSPQKPNSPVAFLDSGRGHAGSAVRLKDHVDPHRNEQGDCRKPD
jgi:hypothetical protein